MLKPLDSFNFEAMKPLQIQNRKPIQKKTGTILQQSEILNHTTFINENEDPIEKRISPNDDAFSLDFFADY